MPRGDEDDPIDDKPMPLIDHLLELRQRLLYSVVAFGVAFAACYFFSKEIYAFLAQPLADILAEQGGGERRMIYTALYEAFFTYLKVAFFGAAFFTFPVWATQLWLFVAPGLYRSEKRAIYPFLIASPFLFIAGVSALELLVAAIQARARASDVPAALLGGGAYLGLLALADEVHVTADNAAMLGDAVASGHPVGLVPVGESWPGAALLRVWRGRVHLVERTPLSHLSKERPAMTITTLATWTLARLAMLPMQIDIDPNDSGLPGIDQLRTIVGAVMSAVAEAAATRNFPNATLVSPCGSLLRLRLSALA